MKLNKEKFLKTELGGSMIECVTAWDKWLTELRKFNICDINSEYRETRKAADWCQAQWEVYQMAVKQFYNIEYHFSRTDEYFGICTEDETDWLFRVERQGKIMNKIRRKRLAEAIDLISQAKDILEEVKDEEQEAYDNLPESFQYGERGEQMQEYIDSIDEAYGNLEEVEDILSEI